MSADDENCFRSDTLKAGKTKSFFTQVKKITRQSCIDHQLGSEDMGIVQGGSV